MLTRLDLRKDTAAYLNSIPLDELFRLFQITRIARIDGLDQIGVPVYSGIRPAAKVVSVSAGKSTDRAMARAGAVAESIEFSVFENPSGSFEVGITPDLGFPLNRGSLWRPDLPISLEPVIHLASGKDCLFPSYLVWLVNRGEDNVQYFQKSSNGQAIGSSQADAILQGLYECVERDQVTLRRISLQELGIYPPRVAVPSSCEEIELLCNRASLKLFLFCCNVDIWIPVYWAILCDQDWKAFAGWGCSLSPNEAATRAILESIQSRVVYISGARDDIERRYVDHSEQKALIRNLSALPVMNPQLDNSCTESRLTTEDELSIVLNRLPWWRDRIYYKHIPINDRICAVKVNVLGFEQPILPHRYGWQPVRWHKLRESYTSGLACTESMSAD